MQMNEKLRLFLLEQKELVKKFEDVVNEFDSSDIVNQNNELKSRVGKCEQLLEEADKKYREIHEENRKLKIALKEQILNEKLNILKISREKMDTYFETLSGESANSLFLLERKSLEKLEELKTIAQKELQNEGNAIFHEIQQLQANLQQRIEQRLQQLDEAGKSAAGNIRREYEKLGSEEISEEVVQKRIKQNNMEMKIGLSWINKVGIFLILIGVATALKYTYSNFFTSHMKGIFAFAIGALFLAGGEWFSRREKSVFAQGLTGGGVAVLYYAVFSSFFILEIIDMNIGLLLSVLVTLTALVLSVRYSSRTICCFALVGGFLPFFTYVFAYRLSGNALYIAMGYLFLLNFLTLGISFYKKWDIANYISFLLNVPTMAYLVFEARSEMAGILYCILTFFMYLIITLAYPFRQKLSLKIPGVVLLGLNTSISCLIVYALFEKADLGDFKGLLAVIFCLVYLGLGQGMSRFMKEETSTQILFYLTSFTFAVLIVPFQFGIHWLTMGWLVEGVLMAVFGYRNKLKLMERGGWLVFGLCISAFYTIDCLGFAGDFGGAHTRYFRFKYFAVVAGLAIMTVIYLRDMDRDRILRYTTKGRQVTCFKYFTLLNFWIYLIFTGQDLYQRLVVERHLLSYEYNSFFRTVLFAAVTVLTALLISKIRLLYDKAVGRAAVFLYILADMACIAVNTATPVFNTGSRPVEYFALVVLLLFNGYAFMSVKDLVLSFVRKTNLSLEVFPIALTVYLLGTVTALFIVQFRLGEVNLLFSLIYLTASFLCIVFGFKRQYVSMRRFGLGLSVFSTAKLFIYDLAFLKTEGRIVSYFAFGVVLIGISFLYQRFKRYIEMGQDSVKVG